MMRLHLKQIFVAYFLVTAFTFIWLLFSFNDCHNDDEVELLRKQIEWYRGRLSGNSKKLETYQSQVKDLEKRLQETHALMGKEFIKLDIKHLPTIYIITPTYTRLEQKAELTRLSYTLRLVNKIHWIVVEDSEAKTSLVTNFLSKCGIPYTHLNILTPTDFKLADQDPNWLKPRGVSQRNEGLSWLRKNQASLSEKGVVYFADDDNTYDLQLFEEMRATKKVSVWPVGLVGALRYESPVIENGKVTGWFTYWKPDRPFAMDMAGFAVNLKLLLDYPSAMYTNYVQRGYQESTLLTHLGITLYDLEPRADNCTKILVWHTRTEKTKLKNEDKMKRKYGQGSDPDIEV